MTLVVFCLPPERPDRHSLGKVIDVTHGSSVVGGKKVTVEREVLVMMTILEIMFTQSSYLQAFHAA